MADGLFRVVRAALLACALGQALHDLVLVGGQLDDRGELLAVSGQQPVEVVDLRERPRVAVEEEAVCGVLLAQPVRDELVGQAVGDVVARVHDRLDLLAELGLVLDVGPEDVARGDVGDPVERR